MGAQDEEPEGIVHFDEQRFAAHAQFLAAADSSEVRVGA